MSIKRYVDEALYKDMVRWRRDLHRCPETAWTEYVTTFYIADLLKKFGFEIFLGARVCRPEGRMGVPDEEYLKLREQYAKEEGVPENILQIMQGGQTGVVGVLRAVDANESGMPEDSENILQKNKKIAALRFDIDALPIQEDEKHICDSELWKERDTYLSKHPGQMHACGHDGHTAAGLAVAKILSEHIEIWQRTYREIRLIFQPAEEGIRGAQPIVANGWLDDVDLFLSGHVGLGCTRLGEIRLCTAGFLASTKINLTFRGKAAHAAKAPQDGKNALLAAANFVLNAHAISRNSDGQTLINVGKLVSGTGANIIPDEAYLELEIRGESTELNTYMYDAVCRLAQGAAHMYDVSYGLERAGEVIHAVSDRELLQLLKDVSEQLPETGEMTPDVMEAYFDASEDAAIMMQHVQNQGGRAGYFLFGTPLLGGHHQSNFDFDERVLGIMAEFYVRCLIKE